MLTFVINGDAHQVTADQFRTPVDVAVGIMADASRDSGVEFTIGALHPSAPTIVWNPQAKQADTTSTRRSTRWRTGSRSV